jgi:hypothetical protein
MILEWVSLPLARTAKRITARAVPTTVAGLGIRRMMLTAADGVSGLTHGKHQQGVLAWCEQDAPYRACVPGTRSR